MTEIFYENKNTERSFNEGSLHCKVTKCLSCFVIITAIEIKQNLELVWIKIMSIRFEYIYQFINILC